MIDRTSREIIDILQESSRTSNAEIGRRIGLTTSAVHERIRRLQDDGAVERFTARVNRERLGWGVTCFVHLKTRASLRSADVAAELARIDEVLEVHDIAGADCFLLKVIARDLEHLHDLIQREIGAVEDVESTATTIVLKTFKETTRCPIPQSE